MCSSDLSDDWTFVSIAGTGCTVTGNACEIVVSADRTVTATWKQQLDLTITKSGTGSVALSGSTPYSGTTCGALDASPCVFEFYPGDDITLTADVSNADDWTFVSLAGTSGTACVTGGTANVCTITDIDADTAVAATWKQLFELTVDRVGSGTITFSGATPISGTSCLTVVSTDCVATFKDGDTVTVTADVDDSDDWTFVSKIGRAHV